MHTSYIIKQIGLFVLRSSHTNNCANLDVSGTMWKPCSCFVLLAISHVDMTHSTSTRDKKVFAMCLLGDLGTTYSVIWGICRFIGTPRYRIPYWLWPGTLTTSTRDQKGYAMCLLGALGTTYRVIWGISSFVGTPRCIISYRLGPGTYTSNTRDQKG